MGLNDTEKNENGAERPGTAPPVFRAASNLAAMQAEAVSRLWEYGHVYAEHAKS